MKEHKQVLEEALKDPEFRKEYEALKPEYEEIGKLLKENEQLRELVKQLKDANRELDSQNAIQSELLDHYLPDK